MIPCSKALKITNLIFSINRCLGLWFSYTTPRRGMYSGDDIFHDLNTSWTIWSSYCSEHFPYTLIKQFSPVFSKQKNTKPLWKIPQIWIDIWFYIHERSLSLFTMHLSYKDKRFYVWENGEMKKYKTFWPSLPSLIRA